MKLGRIKNKDPEVTRLQARVGDLFSLIPFEEGQPFEVKFYPAELPLSVSYNLSKPPQHLILTYLQNQTNGGSQPTNGVWVDWNGDAGTIRINNVTGLTAANYYLMRFLVFA